jgi:hypothetical protein
VFFASSGLTGDSEFVRVSQPKWVSAHGIRAEKKERNSIVMQFAKKAHDFSHLT